MTIAAGFVCSDGLLFACDTLYSGNARVTGDKFWSFETDRVALICGGSGTLTGLRRTIDEIEHQLHPSMNRWDVLRAIESSIAMVDKRLGLEGWDRTRLLVGTREDGKTQLHENDAGSYGLTRTLEASQCVGEGYSLGRYFARFLFHPNMSIKWAEIVAAHLIKNVKTYDEQHCGGDTHLFELPNNGEIQEIRDRTYVSDLERHLAQVEDALKVVLPDGSNVSDHTLNERFARLTEVILNLQRAQFVRLSGLEAQTGLGDLRAGTLQPLGSPVTLLYPPTTPSAPETPQDSAGPPDLEDPKGKS